MIENNIKSKPLRGYHYACFCMVKFGNLFSIRVYKSCVHVVFSILSCSVFVYKYSVSVSETCPMQAYAR
jgi:hypothetical protein